MKQQHTTHSLQRNHGVGRLLRAESADGDVMQQEYNAMCWIAAAQQQCAPALVYLNLDQVIRYRAFLANAW